MELQTGNVAVGYPVGTQKPDIQMRTLRTWDFFFLMLLCFIEKKNKKTVRYTRTLYSQTGKNMK